MLVLLIASASAQYTTILYMLSDGQPSTINHCQVNECYYLSELLNSTLLSNNISNTLVILHPGVHTVYSSSNEAFSFNNATNFTLTTANSSERTTIKCKGRTAFAFIFCRDLTILGINFEGCTSHIMPVTSQNHEIVISDFALLILYSLNINISAITARNSGGIGLLVINVCGPFVLSDSKFTNNTLSNICFLSKDSINIISIDTDIDIKNSKFETSSIHSNLLTDSLHSAGIALTLLQTTFNIRVLLSNITLIKLRITIDFKFPTNQLKIENVTSVNLNYKLGMLISSSIDPSPLYNCTTYEAAVMINNAQLRRSNLYIINNGKSERCKLHMTLSNILLDNVGNEQQYSLLVSRVPSIIVRNVTIQNMIGTVTFIRCNLKLQGQFIYQHNHGSVVLLENRVVIIYNTMVIISDNTAIHYAPFFIVSSEIGLQKSFITVIHNTGPVSGGIVLANSTVCFTDDSQAKFLLNSGEWGGAMAFYQRSKLIFCGGMTNFTFIGNYAGAKGGAIYVHDEEYVEYQLRSSMQRDSIEYLKFTKYYGGHATFHTCNNYAAQAGSAVFGGFVDDNFHFHSSSVNDTSMISSTPFKVCMCTDSKPNCSIENVIVELQPGQSYTMEITAVGQRDGTVPSTIRTKFAEHSKSRLIQTQYVQPVGKTCTNLTYTVQFSRDIEILQLTTADQTWRKKVPFNITFYRKDCAIGFIFDTKTKKCICNQRIIDHGMECDIQTLKISRLTSKWINVTYEHLDPTIRQPGVIVHDYCPFDYCLANSQQLDLHYPDQQCNLNHAGILCGACLKKFSHILGTSQCKRCTKPWIALIIPLIAVAGIALVVGLMFLNLTVSVGTINGLIFYANIVQANRAIFFPRNMSASLLSTFIAWLNLDLGIEICFYDGLNAYSKTWFQFLFPLYIWFILSAIIIVSHYSTRISMLVGNNAVQVLATLFLLSYAKLLRIIITVFSSTELIYPDSYHRRVWLYDGNVDYLKGKHIPLFMAALILVIFISFPFTMSLFCTQCMQRLSNKRFLSWVGKLQPLFDAYTGPYKINHRYWTGLLLLIRICFFLVFSLNTIGNPMINLLAICTTTSCLLAYLSLVGGVYKQWWLNLMETAFILNLLILSSGSFYQINTGSSIKPVSYTSASIALVLFISILIYHVVLKVTKTKFIQKTKIMLTSHIHLLTKLKSGGQNKLECSKVSSKPKDEVTYSEVRLEEPLLKGD